MLTRTFAGAASLLFATMAVAAPCGKDPECDDVAAWTAFTKFTLRQSVSGTAATVEWVGLLDRQANDVSVDVSRLSDPPVKATVAMVGGYVLMSRGHPLRAGQEIETLDASMLGINLVMALLNRAVPNGPDSLAGQVSIDRTSSTGIKFATSTASGYIAAPWHLKGYVSRSTGGSLPFDLTLAFPYERAGKRDDMTVTLKGELAMSDRPVFADAESLADWTVHGQDPKQAAFATIGDIRAFIAIENHPGVRDATKDFTGFWKVKCDQAFGLQVKRTGEDGKYAVVFCGPGGCGNPESVRPSYLTGDRRYEVVSESEFVTLSRSGERTTYVRCTKDPHPVLKY